MGKEAVRLTEGRSKQAGKGFYEDWRVGYDLLAYLFSDGLWEWVIHRVWEEEVEGRMRKEGRKAW